jgi:repressor LexA
LEDLSARQSEILEFIVAAMGQTGICPSYREIGRALGIGSTNGVSDHIKALERKGYIERFGGRGASRSIRLTDKAQDSWSDENIVGVPLLGRVAAGEPLLAVENYENTIRMDQNLMPPGGKVFALVVQGESMIEDGIHDGDTVFVQQRKTCRNGEIAVVLVEGEATVKRFFHEGPHVRLQPANSSMKPIFLNAQSGDVEIVGTVVGLFRQM